jgi:hypothetical protein
MRWIGGLSKSQRVVVVIALGLALGAVGGYLMGGGSRFGWYAYSPFTAAPYPPAFHGWLRLIIWLVLIGLWAVASIRVLRPSSESAAEPGNE